MLEEAAGILKALADRHDPAGERMKRFWLCRICRALQGSLHELTQRIGWSADFKNFDIVEAPEIVSADISFNLFNFRQTSGSQQIRYLLH